ncbi:DUF2007 domain-containing protein [Bacteroides sp. 224]|uniref:putative signal transducing protein n=1 Tax=Bacteroides sp. 224 TaxID=2302936 RepID=UPI0013D7D4E5|nr:DUF2007 domain-containing protein [Bacteroides sp. 224]NDV64106.1 DUF2007 domain-containing protein [Bacteroides sp. 224]
MTNWITIITFIYPHEAHIAKGVLESEGIDVFIKDEMTAQVNNFYSTAIGGVKLLVNEEQRERALQILEEAGYIKTPEDSAEPESKEFFGVKYSHTCPYCNSQNVMKERQPSYTMILSILFFMIPIPFLRRRYHCFDCDQNWRVRK